MEEGGGHGFFVLVVVLEEGEGEEGDGFPFLLLVLLFVFWLVGCSFLVSCSREVIFLYQLSSIMQDGDILFSFFFFFLSPLFFWLSWRGGWIMHLRVEPID